MNLENLASRSNFIYKEIPFRNDWKKRFQFQTRLHKLRNKKTKPFYKIPILYNKLYCAIADCRLRVIRMDCVTIAFFDHNDQKTIARTSGLNSDVLAFLNTNLQRKKNRIITIKHFILKIIYINL